eukprot:PITA_02714
MANCMLKSKSLAPKLWDEAISCVAYIQSCIPHKALKGITQFECWTEDKEKVMATPIQLPTRAEKTLQDVGELVNDPTDARMTRSQLFGAPQAVATIEPLIYINFYMKLGSNPQSHFKGVGNLLWEAAMDEEYYTFMEHNTWDLVPLPKGRKLVRCEWIYQTDTTVDGDISKYKVSLVAK